MVFSLLHIDSEHCKCFHVPVAPLLVQRLPIHFSGGSRIICIKEFIHRFAPSLEMNGSTLVGDATPSAYAGATKCV